MIHIRAGSPAQKLISLLSVCGEYPLCALSLLGDARWYRETVRRLTTAETVRIGGENLRGKLLTLNGRGQDRSVRLSSGAIPILTWIGAWDFYRDTQWVHKFPGGAHRDRRLRCGEAIGMSMEAGIECRPYRLPNITEAAQSDEPAFYCSTELKRAGGNEIRKLGYSRAVGALLTSDRIHAVYNTRGAVMKWLGRGEVRMRDDLAVLGQGRQADSCILFGRDEAQILKTFQEATDLRVRDFRMDAVYTRIYAVPLNRDGVRLLRLLVQPRFGERLLNLLFPPETRSYHRGVFPYDARIGEVYVQSFLNADICALNRFRQGMERYEGIYEIVCYPHQVSFLQAWLGKGVRLRVLPLDAVETAIGIGKGVVF